MTKPYVGQGWAMYIEPFGDDVFCHLRDEDDENNWDEDIFDLEYALEQAEYWQDR